MSGDGLRQCKFRIERNAIRFAWIQQDAATNP